MLHYFGTEYRQDPQYGFPVFEPTPEVDLNEITVTDCSDLPERQSYTLCKNARTLSVLEISRGLSIQCL